MFLTSFLIITGIEGDCNNDNPTILLQGVSEGPMLPAQPPPPHGALGHPRPPPGGPQLPMSPHGQSGHTHTHTEKYYTWCGIIYSI